MEPLCAVWQFRRLPGGVIALVVCLQAVVYAYNSVDPTAQPRRLVHRFDFDERDEGNLEDLPKYWSSLRPEGFPRFAYGRFDFETGRLASPSFYLASEGRNVAYHYIGPDTRVQANNAYRIEGFIRADRLTHARACLGAHFLDMRGRPVPDTLVRSRYVGGSSEPDEWVRVDLFLPGAPSEAFTIGLHAWVLQEQKWNAVVPSRRHIIRRDVFGGAWFDDISIYALPRVELTAGAPGNVLPPDGPQELWVTLADNEDTTLEGRLEISAADGEVLATETIPVVVGDAAQPVRIPVDHLPPGLYYVRLDVVAGEAPIVSQTLAFARLAPLFQKEGALARPFGVVIDPRFRCDGAAELALLTNQAVRSVKLPIWTGLAEEPPSIAQQRATDRLLQELARRSFGLTGVLFGPPSAIVRGDGAYARPLIALLNESPTAWQEHLAAVVAPYASVFHWWQVGADDGDAVATMEEYVTAISQLREAMRRFITMPLLSVPASTTTQPADQKLPAEQLSVTLGRELHPDWFASQIKRFDALGYEYLAAYIQPLPRDQYDRTARLADWAQRIISARHAGADSVFVPQTWRVRDTAQGRLSEPTEEYLIFRTIADVLAGAAPGQRVPIAPGVHCLAFDDGESTILAMWDPQAPPAGSPYTIQLGQAHRQIDPWGRAHPLERSEDGRNIVRLSPTPVLVDGVERWLIDFRTSLALEPKKVETGMELVTHALSMLNNSPKSIAGQARIEVPESWEATRRSVAFNLMPYQADGFAVNIHYPHNTPAGTKQILVKITLVDPPYYLEVPLSVELGLSDVDVRGMAVVEGKDLVLRHVLTNRSTEVLDFRGSASIPGRERQYRPFSDLRPGDTQMVDYRIAGGASLVGSKVRLGLVELNDGPRKHLLELIVP